MVKIYCVLFIQILYCLTVAQSNKQTNIDWPILSKSPWPMTYGSPQATGRTSITGPKTNNIKWQINKPYGTSGGPVISSSNNLYFGSDLNLYFYSMKTDTNLNWSYKGSMLNYVSGAMLVDIDENIYFGTNDKNFNKFDIKGNLIWQFQTGGVIRVPLINMGLDSVLYFTSADSNAYAITFNGKLKWKTKMGSGFAFSSPTLSPDYKTIYICGRDSNLYAFNLDGSLKWKYSSRASITVPIVDAQNNIYILLKATNIPAQLVSVKTDGTVRWTYNFDGQVSPSLGTSLCMDLNGNLFVVNRIKILSFDYYGKLRWDKAILPSPSDITCPIVCDGDGKIYFGCSSGTYYYCYGNDGTLIWTLPLNGHNVDWAPAFGPDGTMYIGVHKGPNKISMIAVKDNTSDVFGKSNPTYSFELRQNYPNPFNPVTTISYSIPENSKVSLIIYNILGNEVRTLVDDYRNSGVYNISFNCADLPSGIYIYTLQAAGFKASKKLLLMK